MYISQLPEDIILIVLQFVQAQVPKIQSAQYQHFRITAVCSQWRRIALRMAYHQVSLEDVSKHQDVFDKYERIVGIRTFYDWQSNLDLILANGYLHFVRSISIRQVDSLNRIDSLENLLKAMHMDTIDWRHVTELDIVIYGNAIIDADDVDDDDVETVSGLAQQFAERVPNITKLVFNCLDKFGITNAFLSKLVECYSPQLQKYNGVTVLPNFAHTPCNQLTYLKLDRIDFVVFENDCVCSLPLRHLILIYVPFYFSWDYFFDNSNGKELVFQELTTLSISYTRGDINPHSLLDISMEQQKKKLAFPKLQHLEVLHVLGNCPILFHSKLPTFLTTMTLGCTPTMARILSATTLPKSQSIKLLYTNDRFETNQNDLQVLNNLLKTMDAKLHFNLICSRINTPSDLNLSDWHMITHLKIGQTFDANHLLMLIGCFTNVRELNITNFDEHIQLARNLVAQLDNANTHLQKINSSLKYLTVGDVCINMLRPFIRLLRLIFTLVPTLQRAKVNRGELARTSISKYSDARLAFMFQPA